MVLRVIVLPESGTVGPCYLWVPCPAFQPNAFGKHTLIGDVSYVVSPMMFGSALNVYRILSSSCP